MTKAHNGNISTEGLELPSACDICGKSRAHGGHVKCSKIRQAQYRAKRAAK